MVAKDVTPFPGPPGAKAQGWALPVEHGTPAQKLPQGTFAVHCWGPGWDAQLQGREEPLEHPHRDTCLSPCVEPCGAPGASEGCRRGAAGRGRRFWQWRCW